MSTTIDELESLVRSSRSITLDVRACNEFPGYVRSVHLREGNVIGVDFEQYGYDEGGAYFNGRYASFMAAVEALERYLGCPIAEWQNREGDYPVRPSGSNEGGQRLIEALQAGAVPLPRGTQFELGSSYWGRFARPDGPVLARQPRA
jgi:hypothetical protein